jgi:NAD(P)H-nitrite reductase large subunit
MIVCHCRAVGHGAVLDAIDAGACDVDDVADRCGAGAACGGCRPTVARLLSGSSVSSHPGSGTRQPVVA